MAKTCKGCVYYRSLSENSPNLQPYCNYLLDTGEPRRCPAENCDKKLTKEEAMKKLTQDDKHEIIRLRIEGNVPVKTIAEKFHVSKSAVFNIIAEWKKHGDSAISEEEIINELHEQTISEAADDSHICYEVTGDTDIEAYMADRNEKKPDTAATVTDSEQEDLVDVPADIIHDNSENVKPVDDLLPCAVVDAIADQIDRLYDSLTECDRKVQEIQTARANVENDLKELRVFLKENGYGDVVKALNSGAKWRALQGEK